MADIHSRFILDDQASNPLAGYITVAKNAASATTAAQRQLKSYESALRSTELASAKATAAFEASAQQLDAMRAAGEAGTAAYKQLETQNERLRLKVEALGIRPGQGHHRRLAGPPAQVPRPEGGQPEAGPLCERGPGHHEPAAARRGVRDR